MWLKDLFKKKEQIQPTKKFELDSEFIAQANSDKVYNKPDLDSLEFGNFDKLLKSGTEEDLKINPFQNLLNKNEEFNFSSKLEAKTIKDKMYLKSIVADLEESMENEDRDQSLNESSQTLSSDLITFNSLESHQKKLPLIGFLPSRKQYQIAGGIFLVGFLALLYSAVTYNNASTNQSTSLADLSNLQTTAQKLDSSFTSSVIGKKEAYENLMKNWKNLNEQSESFIQITDKIASKDKDKVKQVLEKDLLKIKGNIDSINKESKFLKNSALRVNAISNEINSIYTLIDKLSVLYVQNGANQNEINQIYYLKNTLQSINENITKLLLSDNVNLEMISDLEKYRKTFRKSLSEVYTGNKNSGINPVVRGVPLKTYEDLANKWVNFADKVDTVITRGPELIKIRTLSLDNSLYIKELDEHLMIVKNIIEQNKFEGLLLSKILAIISAITLVLSFIMFFKIYSNEKDNRNLDDKIANNQTQNAIYMLVQEMLPLQEGDLTKKATVPKELIGLIAKQVNDTVESLSSLVKNIKETSLTMRSKTKEVNTISVEMLNSSKEQASSIQETGEDIIKITKAIVDISQKTTESAFVAENSVKVSEEGANHVLDSINSMKEINNQMTETVHLMKTVNDSSKQISEIVELLSDIAESTAILALNATVQAAKAGEAGKGFKIVADEIQSLADSAGEKARSVGALIASAQTAIQAMENAVSKTTNEVGKGVALSEKAGQSLSEITQVSYNLAFIVRSISEDAQENAILSTKVEQNMKEILKKTTENQQSTQKTASSIAEISEISNELGNSVQSFVVE